MTTGVDPLVVQACTGPKTWIEIRMLGEDNKPLANETYRIQLSNGQSCEGQLDAQGSVRLEGIDPGTCLVTFPELDQQAWEAI